MMPWGLQSPETICKNVCVYLVGGTCSLRDILKGIHDAKKVSLTLLENQGPDGLK